MAKNVRIEIDYNTCVKYKVNTEIYVARLKALPAFSEAEINVVISDSALDADYSRGGAIKHIASEGDPIDHEEMMAAGRTIFFEPEIRD